MAPPITSPRLSFGLFEADPQSGELWKSGFRVKLQSQPFKVLMALLERPGQVVTREELQLRVWGRNTNVDFDHSLGTAINKIREALGDSAENPRFVETLARRGYRFIAPVTHSGPDPELNPATQVRAIRPQSVQVAVSQADSTPPREFNPARETVPPRPQITAPKTAATSIKAPQMPFWALLALTGSALLAVGLGAFRLGASRSTPAPRRIAQVTHNGHLAPGVSSMENLAAMATDGLHIYATVFDNGRAALASIPLPEGTVLPLNVPAEVAGPALGDISPDGARLLLRDHLSPASEQPLWVVPTEGGSALRVGNVVAHDAGWMPDGSTILFANGNQLYTARQNEGAPQLYATLPGRAFWLRWSPDGSLLRFTIIDPLAHTLSLWQLSPSDRKPRQILGGFAQPASECCGVWTGDGKWFVFQSSRGGNTDLWRIATNGTGDPERITNGPLQFEAPLSTRTGSRVYFLGVDARSELNRLSPAGEFARQRGFLADAVRLEYTRDGQWVTWTDDQGKLWRARADGGERLQLTPESLDVFMARWSPDGAHLALMARSPGQAWRLYAVDADGNNLRPLMNEARNAADPSWAPDGKTLVFGRTNDLMGSESARTLELLDLNTGAQRPVPGSDGLFSPRWSPDGRYIAALTLDQSRVELFDVATQRWRVLPVPSGADPVWSSDSRYLFLHAPLDPAQPLDRISIPDGTVKELVQLANMRDTTAVDFVFSGLAQDGTPLVRTRVFTGNVFSVDLKQ